MSDRARTIAKARVTFAIAEDAHAALTEVLEKEPRALVILYEVEEGVMARPVPDAEAITRGLVDTMHESMHDE